MDNNFEWNLGGDFIAHYGRGHDENTPGRGSGRYPWGSGAKNGKTPIHEHGEKKHKHSSNNSQEDADAKARKAAQAAGLDQGDNWKMYRMAQAGDERAKKIVEEWEEKYGENNGKLKIPAEPLYETKITGGLFNKKKETVLTEAGKQWQSEVADKTKSYYDNMDEENINARVKAFDKWKKAKEKYEEEPSMETYRKEGNASNALRELVVDDGNKILGTDQIFGEVKVGESLYGNYKDNHDAYNLGWKTFNETYMDILNNKRHVSHSGLDPDTIVRILNTPI